MDYSDSGDVRRLVATNDIVIPPGAKANVEQRLQPGDAPAREAGGAIQGHLRLPHQGGEREAAGTTQRHLQRRPARRQETLAGTLTADDLSTIR